MRNKRLLSNLFTSYRSKILADFFFLRIKYPQGFFLFGKSYLGLFLRTSTLVHHTKFGNFPYVHVLELKTECCSHSWPFWVILVTSICHLQTNSVEVPGLEMEPFGTEINTTSEMLKCLNELIHSNHFVPKILTLQTHTHYKVTTERTDIIASLHFKN